jgi:hypothetical protein
VGFLEVDNINSVFAGYKAAEVEFVQPLRKERWGASTFIALTLTETGSASRAENPDPLD